MIHIKRLAAPTSWAISRKDEVYIATPLPGKHTVERGMAASVVLKELIPLAHTTTEVKRMLKAAEVLVDGKRITEYKHSIGFLDVVSVPSLKEHYRLLIDTQGRLVPLKITDKEAHMKPVKITSKRAHSKGQFQLGTSDGRTILTKSNEHAVGDTLILEVPSQKILEHIKLEKGTTVYLTGGKHIGEHGAVEKATGSDVTYKPAKGESTTTLQQYALALGKTSPITLP